jgi:hypothetical protein
MDYKKVVSDAIEESEKKQQEKEIAKIKEIVSSYLNKISEKEDERKKIDKEIRILKDDLDDLKMGRLDKIEERQAKDPDHNSHTLIIIKRVEREYIPYQPWFSPWLIEMKPMYYGYSTPTQTGYCLGDCTSASSTNSFYCDNSVSSIDCSFKAIGTDFQNFSQGTYTLDNGKIINL